MLIVFRDKGPSLRMAALCQTALSNFVGLPRLKLPQILIKKQYKYLYFNFWVTLTQPGREEGPSSWVAASCWTASCICGLVNFWLWFTLKICYLLLDYPRVKPKVFLGHPDPPSGREEGGSLVSGGLKYLWSTKTEAVFKSPQKLWYLYFGWGNFHSRGKNWSGEG